MQVLQVVTDGFIMLIILITNLLKCINFIKTLITMYTPIIKYVLLKGVEVVTIDFIKLLNNLLTNITDLLISINN